VIIWKSLFKDLGHEDDLIISRISLVAGEYGTGHRHRQGDRSIRPPIPPKSTPYNSLPGLEDRTGVVLPRGHRF
jgi:hypothetical protein